MSEIEWLDGAEDEPPARRSQVRPAPTMRDRLAASLWVLWTIAGALTVAAPFRNLYGISLNGESVQRVDGWGRSKALTVAEGTGAHTLRFGVVCCAVAALILVALAFRRVARSRSWAESVVTVLTVLAIGGAVATTAVMFLDFDAVLDSIRSVTRLEDPGSDPTGRIGAAFWMMLTASAIGSLALTLDLVLQPHVAPGSQIPEVAAFVTPGNAQDENL